MCVYCAIGELAFGLAFSDEHIELPLNFKPFIVPEAHVVATPLFTLRVSDRLTDSLSEKGDWTLVHNDISEADMPRLEIYQSSRGWLINMSMTRDSEICAMLRASSDFAEAELAVCSPIAAVRDFAINNATMLLFAFTALKYKALELHASVVVKDEKGYLFLGKSGTGKSTHSRMWLEAFEDAWLLNDDNPVVRIEDDGVWVYGSPWSGKTPCYKNARARVGAFVRLHQAPQNSITKARPSKAYVEIYGSCSGLKFTEAARDELYEVIRKVIEAVPVWELDCLPNHDAAYLCCESVSIKST